VSHLSRLPTTSAVFAPNIGENRHHTMTSLLTRPKKAQRAQQNY
jgi:hypothetical protein